MIPWKKQNIWFWFAAIMIVCGAACFLNHDASVRSVRKKLQSEKPEPKIARSLESLSEFAKLEPEEDQYLLESQVSYGSRESKPTIGQFHNSQLAANDEQKLQRATLAESGLARATLLAPRGVKVDDQLLQLSTEAEGNVQQTEFVRSAVTQEQPKRETKPLVWFSGSIEKIDE